jgi:hypothetical protein
MMGQTREEMRAFVFASAAEACLNSKYCHNHHAARLGQRAVKLGVAIEITLCVEFVEVCCYQPLVLERKANYKIIIAGVEILSLERRSTGRYTSDDTSRAWAWKEEYMYGQSPARTFLKTAGVDCPPSLPVAEPVMPEGCVDGAYRVVYSDKFFLERDVGRYATLDHAKLAAAISASHVRRPEVCVKLLRMNQVCMVLQRTWKAPRLGETR